MNMYSDSLRYKEQSIQTMTARELLGVVLDELVRRLYLARQSLHQQDFALFEQSLQRAVEIYNHLRLTLDHRYPISAELYNLYRVQTQFLYRLLASRSHAQMDEAVSLASDLRDTWWEAEQRSHIPSSRSALPAEGRAL